MQEVMQSIQNVTAAQGFWFYMGGVISLGMVVGNRFDDRYRGFRKSVTLLAPYVFILILTTASRLYETSLTTPIGANAYNGLVTLIILTFFYITGLFLGHVILQKAHRDVRKENYDTPALS